MSELNILRVRGLACWFENCVLSEMFHMDSRCLFCGNGCEQMCIPCWQDRNKRDKNSKTSLSLSLSLIRDLLIRHYLYAARHSISVRISALKILTMAGRANWHSSTTLTEVSPSFFLSCRANAMAQLAMKGHRPHSSQLGDNFYAVSPSLILVWPDWVRIPQSLPTKVVNCVVLCIVCV
jgi:hypothetical protein